jgi:hypothetical protein
MIPFADDHREEQSAMHATLDADFLSPSQLKTPEMIRSAKLQEEIGHVRAFRQWVDEEWFDLPLEVRVQLRSLPQRVEAAIKRPTLGPVIQAAVRFVWHLIFDYDTYFPALHEYVREAGRVVDTIRAKVDLEDRLHQQLFTEADIEAMRASQAYAELRGGKLIRGSVEDLRRRREVRRSRATG